MVLWLILPWQVADLIKLDRLHRLNDLVNECAGERSERYVGTVQEILVDGANPKVTCQARPCEKIHTWRCPLSFWVAHAPGGESKAYMCKQ